MSRTDVHRPVWVMEQDPTIRHWFKDFHDHRDGICDLQYFLDTAQESYWFSDFYCTRQIGTQCPNLCGCWMCTGSIWHKQDRRRARALWRRQQRDLVKTPIEDLEDVDVPPYVSVN